MQRWIPLFLAVAALLLVRTAPAEQAFVVNRIVAVVDEDIVTWQELRARMVPFERKQVNEGKPLSASDRAALAKSVLGKMIDERLVAHAADRAQLAVTVDEIDHAVALITKTNNLTLAQLTGALTANGMSMIEYRDELRRQILLQKYLHVMPGDPWDASATEAEHNAWADRKERAALKALHDEAYVDVRL